MKPTGKGPRFGRTLRAGATGCALLLLMFGLGCQTSQPTFSGQQALEATSPAPVQGEQLVLREGDLLKITFPGAPNLNTAQQIRRDGRIALPLVGEFKAAGLTCGEMEKELLKQYAPQLVTKEVNVTVESSTFSVFITGAVLRPGKLTYDRPVTALEAVMEAGVDYGKANLKAVAVIRNERGRVEHYKLNLKRILQGEQAEPFKLKPSDIVFVPEKFTWF